MRLSCIFPCTIVVLLSASTAFYATPLPTNMDLVVDTIEAVVEQALSTMDVPADRLEGTGPLMIENQSSHDANWVVDHILAERLLARGFKVALDTLAQRPGSARLTYRILDLGITGQSGLLSKKVQRQSRATLSLRLSHGGGEAETLDWQSEETVMRSDSIPKDKVEFLQIDAYDFAKTDLEEQTWGKFVEPVIVTTVLGGLVYLFFSNR